MSTDQQQIDPFLLSVLACPACDNRPSLAQGALSGQVVLHCAQCGRSYPVDSSIPILLVDHAILPA